MDTTAQPFVTRAADMTRIGLSPTNQFAYPFAGRGDDHPEVYLETAGRGDGPPAHSHPWATWELVLEGEVLFHVGGEDHVLTAGDAMYTPPGVPHAYMVQSAHARLIGINGPGARLQHMHTRAAPLFRAGGPPDMGKVAQIAAEERITLQGPPLRATRG